LEACTTTRIPEGRPANAKHLGLSSHYVLRFTDPGEGIRHSGTPATSGDAANPLHTVTLLL